MKIALVLLHILVKAKALAPLLRAIDFSNLFLPLKVACASALLTRDALGVSASGSVTSDILTLTVAALLIGLLLRPKPSVAI